MSDGAHSAGSCDFSWRRVLEKLLFFVWLPFHPSIWCGCGVRAACPGVRHGFRGLAQGPTGGDTGGGSGLTPIALLVWGFEPAIFRSRAHFSNFQATTVEPRLLVSSTARHTLRFVQFPVCPFQRLVRGKRPGNFSVYRLPPCFLPSGAFG